MFDVGRSMFSLSLSEGEGQGEGKRRFDCHCVSLIREEECSCLVVLRCTRGRTGSRPPAVFPLALRASWRQTCVRLLRFGRLPEQFAQRSLITPMTVT